MRIFHVVVLLPNQASCWPSSCWQGFDIHAHQQLLWQYREKRRCEQQPQSQSQVQPGEPLQGPKSNGVSCRVRDQLVEQELIYEKLPKDIANRHVLLMDPILATGNSAARAIQASIAAWCLASSKVCTL